MIAAIKAGAAYFGIVFAVAFALGVARTLALAPALGELAAVAIEVPIILALSWPVCGWCVRRYSVTDDWAARSAMGACAFLLLMAAEGGLSILLLGRSLAQLLDQHQSAAAILGLIGQALFALIPLITGRANNAASPIRRRG